MPREAPWPKFSGSSTRVSSPSTGAWTTLPDTLVHYMTTKLGDIQDREQRLKAEAMLQDIARREDALRVLDGYATDESVKGKIS